MKNSMEVSQKKKKNRTTIWPSNSTPGYISKTKKNKNKKKKNKKTLTWKNMCTSMFIFFTIGEIKKQPKCLYQQMNG